MNQVHRKITIQHVPAKAAAGVSDIFDIFDILFLIFDLINRFFETILGFGDFLNGG